MTVGLVVFCRMQIWFFQNPVLSGLVDFLLLFLFLYIVQRSTHQLVMAISADPKKQIGNRIGFGSKSVPIPIRPRISRYIYLSFILGYGLGFISCIHLPKKGFLSLFSPSTQPRTAAALSLSRSTAPSSPPGCAPPVFRLRPSWVCTTRLFLHLRISLFSFSFPSI